MGKIRTIVYPICVYFALFATWILQPMLAVIRKWLKNQNLVKIVTSLYQAEQKDVYLAQLNIDMQLVILNAEPRICT